MEEDAVFSQIGVDSQDLLATSRRIFDSEVARIIEEQREQGDHLYDLLFARAGITDPFLRGPNKHRQALESGEAPIADLAGYFDAEIQDLKFHFNETNAAIMDYALHKPVQPQDQTDSSLSSQDADSLPSKRL